MMTMTSESESPLLDTLRPQETSCDDLDPDFTIEATGGPTDTGGGAQVGPPIQPPC